MKRYYRAATAAAMSLTLLSTLLLSTFLLTSCGGRVDPEQYSAQLSFGIEMARRGLWSEALFRFKKAEEGSPGNARIMNNVASAYEALGQFELALDYYQRALKSSSSNSDLRRNYSRFVEFYRNFKAETENGDEGEEEGSDEGDGAEDGAG